MARKAATRSLNAVGQFSTLRLSPTASDFGTKRGYVTYLTGLNGRIAAVNGNEYAEPNQVDNVKYLKVTLAWNVDIVGTDLIVFSPPGGPVQTFVIKTLLTPQTGQNTSTVCLCTQQT